MLLFTWHLLFIISVIIDLRLQKIVTKVSAHSTAVNTIVINDTDNYFVSGAADGDIKVLMSLLSSFPHLFPSLLIFFPSTFISPGFHLLHIFPLFCLCLFFVLSDQVWDLLTIHELFSFTGKHARTRLFRPEGGVLDMVLDPSGWLYSCGADGTVKVLKLNMDHS